MEAEPIEEAAEAVEAVYEETHEEIPEAPRYEEIHEEVQEEVQQEIPEEVLDSQQRSAAEQEMDTLWKCFHQAVAIPERANEKLQNSLIPLKFREFMNEFQKI